MIATIFDYILAPHCEVIYRWFFNRCYTDCFDFKSTFWVLKIANCTCNYYLLLADIWVRGKFLKLSELTVELVYFLLDEIDSGV